GRSSAADMLSPTYSRSFTSISTVRLAMRRRETEPGSSVNAVSHESAGFGLARDLQRAVTVARHWPTRPPAWSLRRDDGPVARKRMRLRDATARAHPFTRDSTPGGPTTMARLPSEMQ